MKPLSLFAPLSAHPQGDDYDFAVVPYVVRLDVAEGGGGAAATQGANSNKSDGGGGLVTVPYDADGAVRALPPGHAWSRATGQVWLAGTAPPKPPKPEAANPSLAP